MAPRRPRVGEDGFGEVAIVGGGIGGLALALALQHAAPTARVAVYERDSDLDERMQGYGLTLSATNAALVALGLLEELRQRDTASHAHWVFDGDGAVMGYFGRAFMPDEGGEQERLRGNLRVPRQVLRKMLLKRLRPGTVQWGSRLRDFQADSEGVTLRFEPRVDGSAHPSNGTRAALLVGADGVRSKVRAMLDAGASCGDGVKANNKGGVQAASKQPSASEVQQPQPVSPRSSLCYFGVLITTGLTSVRHPLFEQQGYYTLDGTSRLFTMPFQKRDEAQGAEQLTMWQVSSAVESLEEANAIAHGPPGALLDFLEARTGGWHAPMGEVLLAARAALKVPGGRGGDGRGCRVGEHGALWGTPLYDRAPRDPPVKGERRRVTTLGDAAHAMSPFKGQGANTALFDAWQLATWLTKCPLSAAVGNYEREMAARGAARVAASREAAVLYHSPAALEPENAPGMQGVAPAKAAELIAALRRQGVRGGTDHPDDIIATAKRLLDDGGLQESSQ